MCIRGHVHVILNFKDADASGGDPEKKLVEFHKANSVITDLIVHTVWSLFIKVNLHMKLPLYKG